MSGSNSPELFYEIVRFLALGCITIGNILLAFIGIIGQASINLVIFIRALLSTGKVALRDSITFITRPHIKKEKKKIPRILSSVSTRKTALTYFIFGVLMTTLVVLVASSYSFVRALPNPKLIGIINYPVSTKILDRKGRLLYELHSDENRTPIVLKTLPDYVWKATVSVEDKDFFSHNGISVVGGLLRAGRDSLNTRHIQGGSTITQQLIKTSLLSPERTLNRKVREIILALWTEREYSKHQILEMYLNQVPYGGASYGIEAASQTYFNKPAIKLTLSQAAFLAGLPQAPSLYSPYGQPERAVSRRNQVLRSMKNEGYISNDEYKHALDEKLVVKNPDSYIKAPHFVFYVKAYLEQLFGANVVEEGGLRVTTSLDLDLQEESEHIIQDELDSLVDLHVTNGALLVTRPETGEILAMVGSRNYFEDPYGSYNVTTAKRQPGSSIKPIMYSLALEKGYTASSVLEDSPVVFTGNGAPPYSPVNYDGMYHGRVPLRYALANSYNVPAVKVLNSLGVGNFVHHAQNMGLTTLTDSSRYGLSITLGGAEVKLTDMAVAFGVFANYGKKVALEPVLKVVNFQGQELYTANASKHTKNVLSDGIAFIISNILSDNKARERAFGVNSQLVIPNHIVAVKTGTTNSKRDNVTIGYTKSYLTAVWVGNNDNSPMNPQLTSGVTGAAPIWNGVMSYVLNHDFEGKPFLQEGFSVPDSIIQKNCFYGKPEYFVKGTEDDVSCQSTQLELPTPTIQQ